MAVVVTKGTLLFACVALFMTQYCLAQDLGDLNAPLHLAKNQFLRSKASYEMAIETCGKATKIADVQAVKKLNLSTENLKVALYVLYLREEEKCQGSSLQNFWTATTIYKTLVARMKQDPIEAKDYDAELLFGHYEEKFRLQAKYELLPVKTREQLEGLPSYSVPFDLFATLDNLN